MTTFIDFNNLATGTVVDTEYKQDGVTISAIGGSNKAMIFDTANPTGGDTDLATNNLGNVLIISEDGNSGNPDDEAHGGTLRFTFDEEVDVKSLTFLDIEESAWVKFYDADGKHIKTIDVHGVGNNGQRKVDFNVDGVARMDVILGGSGAIDNLEFDVPNAAPDAVDDTAMTFEGDPVVIDLLANDTDADGDQLTVTAVSVPASQGTVVNNGDGTATFTPAPGFIGTAMVSYDISDGNGGRDWAKHFVEVKEDPNQPDGIVSNDNDGELIDVAYDGDPEGDFIDNGDAILPGEVGDDDIVDANGGNDTIKSGEGDDDVYAGSGDDKVEGGAGDDLIFGDSNLPGGTPGGTVRESFEWDLAGVANGKDVGGFTQDTGNVEVTFSILKETGHADTEFESDQQLVAGILDDGNGVDDNSSLYSELNGQGNEADYRLDFSDPVENVSFRVNDIDGDGIVRIKAFDAAGHPITVNLTGGSHLTLSDTDGVAGNDTADSNGGYLADTAPEYSLLVDIPGPVARIEIEHDQDGGNNTGVNVTDVFFDAPVDVVDNGEDGNDMLEGGEGNDTIFGEGGDDTLTGGAGEDVLSGGADADVIFGGAGDQVDGGAGGFNANPALNTDNDTLDLTGQGPFFVADRVADGNGNGFNGTIVFVDGAGVPTGETITFTEIENIIGEEVNRGPDAQDDIATVAEDGQVTIDVLGNDSDPDGDTLTITEATVPADQGTVEIVGGQLVFTPAPNFNGDVTISYTISDGETTDSAEVAVTVTPVNDAPDAVDDTDTTQEDTAIVIDLLANDTDVDGDDLTVTFVSVPANQGTVVNNGDGTATFTPAPDFNGTAMISYDISDGNGGRDWAKHFVEVQGVNDGPVAGDDAFSEGQDGPAGDTEGNVLDNDSDADGDTLRVISITNGTDTATVADAFGAPGQPMTVAGTNGGLITINNGGNILFDPNGEFDALGEGETTTTTVSYTVSDGKGGIDTATVTITVVGANDDPVAVDDTATTDEDAPVVIDLIGNDTDVDGDTLTIGTVTVPADQGTVVDNGDGTVTFTPAPDFNGDATITYTVVDGNGGEDTGEATVTVAPVNDGPVAVDDTATTDEDTPVVIDLLGNDTDADGDTLTIGTVTVPANQGTVVDNGDGTVTFTPAENFNGEATITYTVQDGNGGEDTGEAVVTVAAVNDAPIVCPDLYFVTEDEGPGDLDGNVITNPSDNNAGLDVDPDGDTLTIVAVNGDPAGVGTQVVGDMGGVFTLNADGSFDFSANGEFEFLAPGETQDTVIEYTAADGNGGTGTATLTITVQGINDAPDAINDDITMDEDTVITIDVLANDTDPEDDDLVVTGASVPAAQGTVEVVGNALVFTPAPDFFGEATISYAISDGNGGTDTAEVTVTVENVNDDPVAVDDLADTDEDTPVVIDLIGNDTDVDGDPLTIGTVTVPPEQGTVVDNGDGTVTFTPALNFNGPATITYTVVDGQGGEDTGEATVNVGAVNDGPVAADDTAETDEDTPVTIDVLANDTDLDGDTLEITGATVPAEQGMVEIVGTELVFTPAENFNGEATISYTISDGHGGTSAADVTVTVNPVNDDPVAVDDIETTDEDTPVVVDLIGNDTDVDGDPLTIGTVSVPADQGTVVDNGDGTVTFTPALNFNGPATITYTVVDGNGGEDTGEAVVSVGAVNDGPVANDDTDSTDEDVAVEIDLLANDTDADGDDLMVIDASVPADQGTLNDLGGGKFLFTPAPGFNGAATVTYTISDGNGGTDTGKHIIDVASVNDAPDAVDDVILDTVVDGGDPILIDALDNDSDPDGDPLEITEANVTTGAGDVAIVGNMIEFTPTTDFEGPVEITYTISDPGGLTDTAVITLTVQDGIVTGTDAGELINPGYTGDPGGDLVDSGDNIFSADPADADDDIIFAGGGNDTVEAGPGDDNVSGGAGDDQIHGGPGDDTIAGDAGADTIAGGAGDDSIEGGADDDSIRGGDGSDTILGGGGNDSIVSSDPDNNLKIDKGYPGLFDGEEGTPEAENERDFVDGGAGDDTISTGDDRDTVIGGTGDDVIDGGIDDDEITGDEGNDRIVGGEGEDTIEGGIGNDTIFAGNDPDLGLDQLNIEDDGSNPIFGPDLRPDNGRDLVFGGAGDDVIFGADDDDVLFGEDGNDFIDGEIDDDTIDGGIGDDTLLGGQGRDSIIGGAGDDSIDGGLNRDTIEGGDGNDTISGGNGKDALFGGDGEDVIDGGTGEDLIDGGDGNDDITGSTGNDTITGGQGEDTIIASDGDDLIDGGFNADLIDGGAGNDTITGGNGKDTILGGEGDDVIDSGTGEDSIDGGAGNDDIKASTGDDTVLGGDGDDTINANDGDDLIEGGDGNDVIEAGRGNDTIFGGLGRDTIFGEGGDDVIEGGLNPDLIDGGDGNDTISGGNGKDTLLGGDGDDVIDGGTGEDEIDGGAGADDITGSTGNDTITGGAGNDTIDSGGGTDNISGGDDRDLFINVNAGDVVDGNEGGDDFDVLDLTGSAEPGGSLTIIKDPLNEENGEVVYRDADGNITGTLTFTNIEDFIPCFTPGTLIATPTGERRVEDLEVGDRVITRDNGIQEVRWTGHRALDAAKLKAAAHLNPVLIRRGALGGGLPERDMMVSPQHRVLIASEKAALFFEEREVLVAAKHLVGMDGIDVVEASDVTYIHVMFDQHEVILSDGAWTESFQPGDQSMGSMDAETRAEIFELFPELATAEGIEAYTAARRTLKKHEAVLLTS
ncbi:MAG: cadherin-like domain-containing protein [Pseudomonadota bacterium]